MSLEERECNEGSEDVKQELCYLALAVHKNMHREERRESKEWQCGRREGEEEKEGGREGGRSRWWNE